LLIKGADERLPSEELERIKQDAKRMLHVLGRLGDLSKTMAGEVELVPCCPKDLVSEVVSQLRADAAEKGLRLMVEHVEPIPEAIRTDPMRLKEVLLSLIRNAIKFTEHGSVRIVTRSCMGGPTGPMMTFMVIDTGIGMNDEQAARLFQPSAPVDGAKKGEGGATGLGFAINKRLIELLGGELSIYTAAGAGSEFRVDLPVGMPQDAPTTDQPNETKLLPEDATPVSAPTVR
jgi:signal transduction histidine kinase